MKKSIGFIVGIVALVAALVMQSSRASDREEEQNKELSLLRLHNDYLEKVGYIRDIQDPKAYDDEVNTFLRSYFKDVDEHVQKYGGSKDFDDYLAELDKRAEKGAKDKDVGARKATYEFEKRIFDQMRAGRYHPVWTGTDKGMRLDVVTDDVKMADGSPNVRFELVLWGAQRQLRDEGKVKKMVTNASFDVKFKLFDAKDKLYGELNASGDPKMKIDYPERFVWAFPAQTVLGYYDLPLIPNQVARAEITFTVTSQAASGGSAQAVYTWKLAPPAEWKLQAGQKWEGAQEDVRSEEEIDPNGAAKKAHGPK